jgi:hypothetical protein
VAVIVVIRAADEGTGTQPAVQPTPTPPAGIVPETDYLIDLNTGEMTPLPESIARNSIPDWYAVSPDGTMVAYTSHDEAGRTQVFIASLDGTDSQQVTDDPRGAGVPDWSPGGTAIAYQASGDGDVNNIFVLDLATGGTSQVTHEKPKSGRGAVGLSSRRTVRPSSTTSIVAQAGACGSCQSRAGEASCSSVATTTSKQAKERSPDGSMLAVGCFGLTEGICIANADGANLRALVSDPSLFGPTWSPDGTRIAYYNGDTREVFVVDVATGESTVVAQGTFPHWLDDHTLIVEIT